MARILAALATTRHSDELPRRVVEAARSRGADVDLLLVTEKEEIDRLYQLRADPFLIGDRPMAEILAGIEEEHRRMLRERADEIERLAGEVGVQVARREVQTDYETAVARALEEGTCDVVIWLRHNRSFIARFFLGADEDEVVAVELARRDPT